MEYDLGPNACEADDFYEEEAREHRKQRGIKEPCQCDVEWGFCPGVTNCPYSGEGEEDE